MKIFTVNVFILLFAFSVFAQQQAEVIVTSTYLRKAPDYNSQSLQTLQKGDVVTFLKEREAGGWSYVSVSGGTVKGWILSRTVRSIKEETVRPAVQTPPKKVPSPTPKAEVPATKTNVAEEPSTTPKPAPATTPETPEEDKEVLRIETAEVNLYVRVVDENNRPLKNLKESDFRVYEDGVLQPITSLTVAEVPMINALVIDNSRSLRSQLKKVIEAGKILVAANKPNDETTVVRFVSSDKIEVVQDFTANKNSLAGALDNLFVEGGETAIIDAIYRTAKKVDQYQNSDKKEDVKLRALILVSDGDDRASQFKEPQLFELLRKLNVQIYAVGFTNDLSKSDINGINRQEKARDFLTRLAKETGGKVYFPASMDELPKIAADISGELRTQYLISYAPTKEEGGVNFRQIKVEIADGANNEKRTAITRAGRNIAPK